MMQLSNHLTDTYEIDLVILLQILESFHLAEPQHRNLHDNSLMVTFGFALVVSLISMRTAGAVWWASKLISLS